MGVGNDVRTFRYPWQGVERELFKVVLDFQAFLQSLFYPLIQAEHSYLAFGEYCSTRGQGCILVTQNWKPRRKRSLQPHGEECNPDTTEHQHAEYQELGFVESVEQVPGQESQGGVQEGQGAQRAHEKGGHNDRVLIAYNDKRG